MSGRFMWNKKNCGFETKRVMSPSLDPRIAKPEPPPKNLRNAMRIATALREIPHAALTEAKKFLSGMESWPRPEYGKVLLSSEFPIAVDIFFRRASLAVIINQHGKPMHEQIVPRLRRAGIKAIFLKYEDVLKNPSGTLWPLRKEIERRIA